MAVDKKTINEVKKFIFKAMDKIDKTGQNKKYYKNKFAKMSDKEFI